MSWFRSHTGEWYQTAALKSANFITSEICKGRDGERFGQNSCMLSSEVVPYNKEQVCEHFLVAVGRVLMMVLVLNGHCYKKLRFERFL